MFQVKACLCLEQRLIPGLLPSCRSGQPYSTASLRSSETDKGPNQAVCCGKCSVFLSCHLSRQSLWFLPPSRRAPASLFLRGFDRQIRAPLDVEDCSLPRHLPFTECLGPVQRLYSSLSHCLHHCPSCRCGLKSWVISLYHLALLSPELSWNNLWIILPHA